MLRSRRLPVFAALAALAVVAQVVPSAGAAPGPSHAKPDRARHHKPVLGNFEPPTATDTDPDPDVVRVALTAAETTTRFERGTKTRVWAYNGSVPGPTIRAKVGDRLVVRFCNDLPPLAPDGTGAGPTTIHWHGVENVADMDGSDISQPGVPVGGCFTYDFPLLDAATFWYHAHIRTDVAVEQGLQGTLVVSDPAEDARLGLPEAGVVVLDDVRLDGDGQIAPPRPADPLARTKTLLDGREGDLLLANGRSGQVVNVKLGEPLRLRLVNSANARFMRVSVPGQDVYRIGGDAGLLAAPERVTPVATVPDPDNPGATMSDPDLGSGLLLVPAERAEILLTPRGRPGDLVPVEWHDYPRGRHAPFYKPDGTIGFEDDPADGRAPAEPLFWLRLTGAPSHASPLPPAVLRPVEAIERTGAEPLLSTFGHGPPTPAGNVTFFAQTKNGAPLPFPAVTPEDAQDVSVGDVRVWEITNLSGSDHPFHAHGFFFQPLEIEYVDLDNPANNKVVPFDAVENKDTIRLPGRPGAAMRSRTILRAVTRFDDTGREGQVSAFGKTPSAGHSGGWLFHCHINEHSAEGMKSFIEVR